MANQCTTLFVLLVLFSLGALVSGKLSPLHHHHHHHHAQMGAAGPTNTVAGATMELQSSFFRKVITAALPLVNDMLRNISIPSGSSGGITHGVINFTDFNIAALGVGLSAPDRVAVNIANVSLAVPRTYLKIDKKIGTMDIDCAGWMSIGVNDVGLALTTTIGLNASDNKLAIESVVANATFGKPLDVELELTTKTLSCEIDNGVIQGLLPTIEALVEKSVGPLVAKVVEGALRNVTEKLPLQLVSPPVVTGTSISVDINLASLVTDAMMQYCRLSPAPGISRLPFSTLGPVGHHLATEGPPPIATRDVMFWTTARSIDVLLLHLAEAGKLNFDITIPASLLNTSTLKPFLPKAYSLCPACPLNIMGTATEKRTPTAKFGGDALQLSLNNQLIDINAVTPSGVGLPLLTLRVNATIALTNFSVNVTAVDNLLLFKLALPSLNLLLVQSEVGPFNAAALSQLLRQVLQEFVVVEFNKNFKGIPLAILGFGLTDIEIFLQYGVNAFGANIEL